MKLRIKELREKAGLSQQEMADKMNISQSTYARFEYSTTKIDLERLECFARVVNMDVIDVIAYPERYINIIDIGKEINKNEPEVVVQIKVTASKRDAILKSLFGNNTEILNLDEKEKNTSD